MSDWDQLPGEPSVAYHAFLVYRDLPPAERTVRGLIRVLKEKTGSSHADDTIERWRENFRWDARVAAWDRQLRLARDEEVMREAREQAQRQVKVATAALAFSERYFETLLERVEHGGLQKVDTRTLLGFLSQAVRALQVSTQILRLVSGEPTERVDHSSYTVLMGLRALDDETLRRLISRLESVEDETEGAEIVSEVAGLLTGGSEQ